MWVQKSVRLFCMISIALINTWSSGMEQGNAFNKNSKFLWVRLKGKRAIEELRDIPITVQPNMAQHVEKQVYNAMKDNGYVVPEGGIMLLYAGQKLLTLDDERLNETLFKDSWGNQEPVIVVPALPK